MNGATPSGNTMARTLSPERITSSNPALNSDGDDYDISGRISSTTSTTRTDISSPLPADTHSSSIKIQSSSSRPVTIKDALLPMPASDGIKLKKIKKKTTTTPTKKTSTTSAKKVTSGKKEIQEKTSSSPLRRAVTLDGGAAGSSSSPKKEGEDTATSAILKRSATADSVQAKSKSSHAATSTAKAPPKEAEDTAPPTLWKRSATADSVQAKNKSDAPKEGDDTATSAVVKRSATADSVGAIARISNGATARMDMARISTSSASPSNAAVFKRSATADSVGALARTSHGAALAMDLAIARSSTSSAPPTSSAAAAFKRSATADNVQDIANRRIDAANSTMDMVNKSRISTSSAPASRISRGADAAKAAAAIFQKSAAAGSVQDIAKNNKSTLASSSCVTCTASISTSNEPAFCDPSWLDAAAAAKKKLKEEKEAKEQQDPPIAKEDQTTTATSESISPIASEKAVDTALINTASTPTTPAPFDPWNSLSEEMIPTEVAKMQQDWAMGDIQGTPFEPWNDESIEMAPAPAKTTTVENKEKEVTFEEKETNEQAGPITTTKGEQQKPTIPGTVPEECVTAAKIGAIASKLIGTSTHIGLSSSTTDRVRTSRPSLLTRSASFDGVHCEQLDTTPKFDAVTIGGTPTPLDDFACNVRPTKHHSSHGSTALNANKPAFRRAKTTEGGNSRTPRSRRGSGGARDKNNDKPTSGSAVNKPLMRRAVTTENASRIPRSHRRDPNYETPTNKPVDRDSEDVPSLRRAATSTTTKKHAQHGEAEDVPSFRRAATTSTEGAAGRISRSHRKQTSSEIGKSSLSSSAREAPTEKALFRRARTTEGVVREARSLPPQDRKREEQRGMNDSSRRARERRGDSRGRRDASAAKSRARKDQSPGMNGSSRREGGRRRGEHGMKDSSGHIKKDSSRRARESKGDNGMKDGSGRESKGAHGMKDSSRGHREQKNGSDMDHSGSGRQDMDNSAGARESRARRERNGELNSSGRARESRSRRERNGEMSSSGRARESRAHRERKGDRHTGALSASDRLSKSPTRDAQRGAGERSLSPKREQNNTIDPEKKEIGGSQHDNNVRRGPNRGKLKNEIQKNQLAIEAMLQQDNLIRDTEMLSLATDIVSVDDVEPQDVEEQSLEIEGVNPPPLSPQRKGFRQSIYAFTGTAAKGAKSTVKTVAKTTKAGAKSTVKSMAKTSKKTAKTVSKTTKSTVKSVAKTTAKTVSNPVAAANAMAKVTAKQVTKTRGIAAAAAAAAQARANAAAKGLSSGEMMATASSHDSPDEKPDLKKCTNKKDIFSESARARSPLRVSAFVTQTAIVGPMAVPLLGPENNTLTTTDNMQ